ncbi:acyl-CoA dehydrogenase family protein [Micromonospora sp. R77]|uniref:acyl-CoA dehydrogenase family protein n=1 Tax=Micromonospora sp. R77 TaxID=2925836 RepID=UPI001F60FED8|nr:acyl-CoA dehydrogenase family protein [Micromonospora sp. R77]MCI4066443.1 acyl-CoA dehydrogenase family protein [Micromonospora sp. R77]
MDLHDAPDEAAFRAGLRDWLRERLPAEPRQWSGDELRQWSRDLHRAGYAGLTWPAAHGGRGLPAGHQAIFAEESALAGAPDHLNVIGMNMVGPTLISRGSTAQQARYLPGILSGEILFCQGFSEPDAGSDLAAVRTRAVRVDGGYELHGEKVWSSYAHLADHCLLLARTDPTGSKHQGLTCFLLDMRAPGVAVSPLRQLNGDSDFNQIVLTGARVRDEDVVGEPGQGWSVALSTLAHERGTFGITLTARLTVQFARLLRTVRQYGAQHDPLVRREVAELHTRLQGLRYTGYRSLAAQRRSGEPGPESSLLKLEWSLVHQRVCALAVRVQGGDAVLDGYWQHQRLRSRANTIEGGTSEILRGIVAERVLGLPRSR